MYGSVSITLADHEDALILPTSALLTGNGLPSVMIAKSGRAQRRTIEIGQSDGARMHVIKGLNGNEEIITDGKDAVRDGQSVEVVRR